MIKFNSDNVFVGEIKQILKSFNLPRIDVFKSMETSDDDGNKIVQCSPKYLLKDNFYIYGKDIVRYIGSNVESKNVDLSLLKKVYSFSTKSDKYLAYIKEANKYILNNKFTNINIANHLIIENNIYDSYTHNYLGDYLRFIRDYYNLNLMSLYNCFSNEMPKKLSISINNSPFSISDSQYKIYMVPVKMLHNYTIAIDSSFPVEFTCCAYNNGEYHIPGSNIEKLTYHKERRMSFNSPILYTKLDELSLQEYATNKMHESNLYLLIKIKATNNSSIVVIEGDYRNYNDFRLVDTTSSEASGSVIKYNKTVINFENSKLNENLKFISKLQLLNFNSGTSYPFSDRLFEYLTDNTITHLEKISDNIKRIQKRFVKNYESGLPGIKYIDNYGIWENYYQSIVYETAVNSELIDSKFDILGYVDKDIERKLGEDINLYYKIYGGVDNE